MGKNLFYGNMVSKALKKKKDILKIAPPLFVILAKDIGDVHPLIYALLPNKQAKTYQQLFHRLKQLKPILCPDFLSCDFENVSILSMKESFPNAQINGCLYHLTKNF